MIPKLFVNPPANANVDIPNLSLAYIATQHRTPVVDLNTRDRPVERFLEKEAEVLGVSFQSRSQAEAQRIRAEYLKHYPAARVVSLRTDIDVLCCYPYLYWEQALSMDEPFSDTYPFPDFELFDSFEIFRSNWERGKWPYAIMTSCGCPFECSYCASRRRPYRARSIHNCYEELRRARERWGIRSFTIIDDCFNLKKQRVLEFCRAVGRLGMEWFCTNGMRADLFDEETAIAMSEAGCTTVGFGIESAVPQVLRAINKGETIEQIEGAIDIARKHFRSVSGYFIIGLPGSSYESDMRSVAWAVSRRIYAHFSVHVPSGTTDALFYGKRVQIENSSYPANLQMKLYTLTRGLSWGGVRGDIVSVARSRWWILKTAGLQAFFGYLCSDVVKLAMALRRRLWGGQKRRKISSDCKGVHLP